MNIKITDIFGININNNNHFNKDYIVIDISPDNIDLLLQPINQYNGVMIYKYHPSSMFKNLCTSLNINIDDYVKLGDYIIYDTNNTKILLSNKKNAILTNRYVLIDTIGQLYIWKPYTINRNYVNLGVVCSDQPDIIPTDYVGMIPSDHVKIFESSYGDLYQNDYGLLGTKRNGRRKLVTMNIIHNVEQSTDSNNILLSSEIKQKSSNKWKKYKTTEFILKEADNKWYENKLQIIDSKDINNNNFFRKNKETFEIVSLDDNIDLHTKDRSTYIILILLILIIGAFFYNKYHKKNKIKNIV